MDESEALRVVSISQTLNIGTELKGRLEAVARREQLDATSLGRRVIRAAVEQRERAGGAGEDE